MGKEKQYVAWYELQTRLSSPRPPASSLEMGRRAMVGDVLGEAVLCADGLAPSELYGNHNIAK